MDEIKTPAPGDQPEAQGSETRNYTIVNNKIAFSAGGDNWQEVPDGTHHAVCSRVLPDFNCPQGYRKCMVYFTVTEGKHQGYRARLAYNHNRNPTGPTFGSRSKFMEHARRLFPETFGDGSQKVTFDPDRLFLRKHFLITTKLINGNAMIQNIKQDLPEI